MRDTYDLVIVGAGPGGYVAARKAAGMGMSVALIDRGPVGGTCVNRGCIPAKALLHASTLYREMKSCERFGLHAEEVSFDLQEIYRYKDEAADRMRGELEEEFCRLGVDLIRGSAVICRDRMVRVTDEDGSVSVCQGKNILVAAGAKATLADIPGVELPGLDDSKKLTAKKRDLLFALIQERAAAWAVARVEAAEVDATDILSARMKAMQLAMDRLDPPPAFALIDGNRDKGRSFALTTPHRTVVKGDSLSASIAAASILAKVSRDRYMAEMAGVYPQYAFERHKGYGTKLHYARLREYGPCPIHRRSFLKNL